VSKKNIWRKRFTTVAVIISGAIAGAVCALFSIYPQVPPASTEVITATPEMVKRGQYLFDNVAGCADCHSTRDWSKYAGPIIEETKGRGGDRFGPEIGLPGTFYARNITPAALADWSDGEIKRAMTAGVSRDGSALFPLMPYRAFQKMCESDIDAIITYARTLQPVKNAVPAPQYDFPLQFIVRTIPKGVELNKNCPDPSDRVSYGKYLVTAAGCNDCHSQAKQGVPLPGLELAGGVTFPLPTGGVVRTANLTPDETGLGDWSRARFVGRFKSMDNEDAYPEVSPGDTNTIMPWKVYAGMTEDDLAAIYDYLRTVPAVKNRVVKQDEPLAVAE
jgi:mono/diheme cytochrome c family protein